MESHPLRVCHLGKYYPPAAGGIETHVQTLAQAQAALGLKVRVLCVNHETPNLKSPRTPTHHDHDGPVEITRIGRSANLSGFDLCPTLFRALSNLKNTDLIHLHTPNPTMLLALAQVRPAVPWVVTHHSDVIRQKVLKHALWPFEKSVYGKAARILPTSPLYVEGSKILQRFKGKLEPLPLGLDVSRFISPSPAAIAYAKELKTLYPNPLWLAVGRLVYYKGLDVALRALVEVPGTLMVIGTGPLLSELKQLAASLGVANRVVWKGYASDDQLVGAYHASTAFWFPSNARSEGFGLVQIEALAAGCPVINTHIPGSGVSWVSPHEKTGLTIPMNDHQALANAALRLLNEPQFHTRLATAARHRANTEFSHTHMAKHSLAIYHQALSSAATSGYAIPPKRRKHATVHG